MAMKHPVTDYDTPFKIDPATRNIINTSPEKTKLMQYDHNSERFTFEVPRYIEDHDMSLCDEIQVHYENTSQGTSVSTRKTYRGIQKINNMSKSRDVVTFSWLVPETATMFAGSLKFQLKFVCHDDRTAGIIGYKWHTNVNDDITITAGLSYSDSDINPTTVVNFQSIEIVEIEGGIDIILDGIHYKIYNGSGDGVSLPTNIETTDNRVTSISPNVDHTQYPTAKAVRDLFDSIEIDSDGLVLGNIEYVDNKVRSITPSANHDQYPTAKAVRDLFDSIDIDLDDPLPENIETTDNKVSSITPSATHTQYPTAKAVRDLFDSIEIDSDGLVLGNIEYVDNKVTVITESATDIQYPSAKAVLALVNSHLNDSDDPLPENIETTDNKVTEITESATHTQYPSAKAVRDLFNSIEIDPDGATLGNIEYVNNKVTEITESATDIQYPSAKAVLALVNSIAGGSVPTIPDGSTGKILEVSNGAYTLVPVSSSAVSRYIHDTVKTTSITEKSTDDQLPSAKAVYDLFSEFSESIVSALNTDVEV